MWNDLLARLRRQGIEITPQIGLDGAATMLTDDERGSLAADIEAILAADTRVNRPLTAEETRLWSVDRLVRGDASLTISFGVRLGTQLDPDAVERAAWILFLRHPLLRRRIVVQDLSGTPHFAPLAVLPERLVEIIDMNGRSAWSGFVDDLARRLSEQPFDLADGPLIRFALMKGAGDCALFVLAHHIICDLRSLIVMVRTVVEAALNMPRSAVPLKPLHYYDPPRPSDSESRAFWSNYMDGCDLSPIELIPLGHGDDGAAVGRRARPARTLIHVVQPEKMTPLAAAAARHQTSPAVIAFAAFALTVHRLTGRRNFAISFPFTTARPGEQDRVAMLAKPLLLRVRIDPAEPAETLVKRIGADLTDIVKHAGLGYESIIQASAAAAGEQGARPSVAPDIFFSFGRSDLPFEHMSNQLRADIEPLHRSRTDATLSLWFQVSRGLERGFLVADHDSTQLTAAFVGALQVLYLDMVDHLAAPGAVGGELRQPEALNTALAERRTPLALHVSATFSSQPIEAPLRVLCDRLGVTARIAPVRYATVLADLLDPTSPLIANPNGVGIVLLRVEDFIRDSTAPVGGAHFQMLAIAAEYGQALARAAQRARRPLVAILAPPSDAFSDTGPWAALRRSAEEKILESERGISTLSIIRATEHLNPSDRSAWWDAAGDRLGHVPYPDTVFADLALMAMRAIHERLRRPFKVVVVDCDNTLWRGVVGEDGIDGIVIEPGHAALQHRLKQASRSGILVCLCSKNDEADVRRVFAERRDMALALDDITAMKVNWLPKSHNIRALARELSLGLDSFVFLDDNPVEIAEVAAHAPAITGLLCPTDSETLTGFAAALWPLDRSVVTAEDRSRTRMYQEETQRTVQREAAGDYASFVAGLGLVIRDIAPDTTMVARLAQMTQRTNQFNAAPAPRTDAEISTLLDDPEAVIRAFDVTDRFGAYGIVGLVCGHASRGDLEVDTLLMSCRVLGRGLEAHMIRTLGTFACERGLSNLRIAWRATSRNLPARRFLAGLAGSALPDTAAGELVISASRAAQYVFDPLQAEHDVAVFESEAAVDTGKTVGDPRVPMVPPWIWHEIAIDLSDGNGLARRAKPELWAGLSSSARPRRGWPEAGSPPDVTLPDADARCSALLETLTSLAGEVIGRSPQSGQRLAELGLDSIQIVRLMAALEARAGVVADFAAFAPDRTLHDVAVALARGSDSAASQGTDQGAPTDALVTRDLVLAREHVPLTSGPARPAAQRARNVLLTGATGFLGGRLAAELLARTDADIHCLVRGQNDGIAAQRLRASLLQAGLAEAAAAVGGRLRAVAGDIEEPLFGLGADRFEEFGENLDAVYHNAAKVSFVAPYAELRTSIVEGTRQALILAARGKRKPLHYVSTVAVFMTERFLGVPLVGEDELPETCADALYGYTQAKWTSERLIRTARDRGLAVSVYRPGNITGDSRTGYWTVGDAFTRLLAATSAAASLPAIAAAIDLTPVDFVASALVALSLSERAQGLTHHLVHPCPMSFDDFLAQTTAMGSSLSNVPFKEWVERIVAVSRAEPGHPAAAIVPLLTARRGRSGLTMLELLAFRPGLATARTLRLAAEAGVTPPPVDAALLHRYLSYLEQAGYGAWRLSAAA